jgi:hypothetical protein
MSYVNPETEDLPGLVFTAADTGGVRITSHLSWEDVQKVVPDLREAAGDEAVIDARMVVWAGPYEIYLTIKDLVEGAILVGGAVKVIPGLLSRFAQKHPDLPVTVVDDTGRHIVIDDKKPLSQEEAEAIAKFFADHQDPPSENFGAGNEPI